jgi:hypothetical protein
MNVFKKSFFESDTLPANTEPYTVYFIEENGNAEIYVTNRFSQVKKVGNTEMVKEALVSILDEMGVGAGRTYIARTVTQNDSDVLAVAGTLYDIPPNTFTVDRFFDLSNLNQEGDVVQISNRSDDNTVLKFSGGIVYNTYDEQVPYVLSKSLSEVRLIRSIYRIYLK